MAIRESSNFNDWLSKQPTPKINKNFGQTPIGHPTHTTPNKVDNGAFNRTSNTLINKPTNGTYNNVSNVDINKSVNGTFNTESTVTVNKTNQGTFNNESTFRVTNIPQGTFNLKSTIQIPAANQGTFNTTSTVGINKTTQGTFNNKSIVSVNTVTNGTFNKTSNVSVFALTQGTFNNVSNINIVNAGQGTFNNNSNINVPTANQGTFNNTSGVRINPAGQGTFNVSSPVAISNITGQFNNNSPVNITNNSPLSGRYDKHDDKLNQQYTKLDYTRQLPGPPYHRRSIGQRFGNLTAGADISFIRGGSALPAIIAADIDRFKNFSLDRFNGLKFIAKQQALQLTNPYVESVGPIRPTRIYNPIKAALQIAGNATGVHLVRHGGFTRFQLGKYEDVAKLKNTDVANRLVRLTGALNLGMSGASNTKIDLTTKTTRFATKVGEFRGKLLGKAESLLKIPIVDELPFVSGISGPNSVYGVGWTGIRKSTAGVPVAESMKQQRWSNNTATVAYTFKEGDTYSTKFNFNATKTTDKNATLLVKNHEGLNSPKLSAAADTNLKYQADNNRTTTEFVTGSAHNPYETRYPDTLNAPLSNNLKNGIDAANDQGGGFEAFGSSEGNRYLDKVSRTSINDSPLGEKLNTPSGSASINRVQKVAIENSRPDIDNEILTQVSNSEAGRKGKDKLRKYMSLTSAELDTVVANQNTKDGKVTYINTVMGVTSGQLSDVDTARGYRVVNNNLASKNWRNLTSGESDVAFITFAMDRKVGTTDPIIATFKSNLTSLTDSSTPEWASYKYIGRADELYTYTGFKRTISLGFKVGCSSAAEHESNWNQINNLQKITAPSFLEAEVGLMVGNFIRFTLGGYFQAVPAIITNLSITPDGESTWETGALSQYRLPKVVDITVDLTIIGDRMPTATTPKISVIGQI